MSDRGVPVSPNSSGPPHEAQIPKKPKAELVFGLVYPLGTEVSPVVSVLEDYVRHFGYEPRLIRISDYLNNLNLQLPKQPSTDAERLIDLGNMSCREANRKDFLALAVVSQISKARERSENAEEPQPAYGRVNIIRSLKRPDEILRLRQIYRPGLYVIGVFATEEERVDLPPISSPRIMRLSPGLGSLTHPS
jgi:hypothetical protein